MHARSRLAARWRSRCGTRRCSLEVLEPRSLLSAAGLAGIVPARPVPSTATAPATMSAAFRPGPCQAVVRSGSIAAATPTPSVTTNWAGYAVATDLNSPQSGAVSDVSGTWVVPSVTGSSSRDTYSSVWVGIDGYATTSNTVEQIGTESDYSSGQPVYYAWYEMYPAYPVTLNMTIQPGDTIHAEVRYLDSAAGSDRFQLTLTDTPPTGRGAPATFTKALTITGDERSSAEWIVEAPSSGTRTLPLADFSAATITDASATLNGETGPIDAFGGISQINMGSAYSTKAATSGLTDSAATPATSSFTVTYGPATSNPPTVTGVSPATGLAAGGTNVTITGTNLANADEVLFGSKAAQITGDNATQISVVTPAGTPVRSMLPSSRRGAFQPSHRPTSSPISRRRRSPGSALLPGPPPAARQ